MGQQLGAFATLVEYQHFTPTSGGSQPPVTLVSGYLIPSFGLHWYFMHVLHIQTSRHTYIYINKEGYKNLNEASVLSLKSEANCLLEGMGMVEKN